MQRHVYILNHALSLARFSSDRCAAIPLFHSTRLGRLAVSLVKVKVKVKVTLVTYSKSPTDRSYPSLALVIRSSITNDESQIGPIIKRLGPVPDTFGTQVRWTY